jgi:hypothetical protein
MAEIDERTHERHDEGARMGEIRSALAVRHLSTFLDPGPIHYDFDPVAVFQARGSSSPRASLPADSVCRLCHSSR